MEAAPKDQYAEDRDLAAQCVAGNRVAQRALFEKMKRRVHATLYRVFGTNHLIDDLIQEAFVQVYRSLSNYRAEASLATWVDRCTVRVAYAALGAKKRRSGFLELVQDHPSNDASLESRVLAKEATRRLYAVLEKLEANQRLAFTLHVIGDHSIEEVAQLMDATPEATKTRIFRARKDVEERARKDHALQAFLPKEGV